jgi:hypothetical protein
MTGQRTCPIDGCGHEIARGRFLCRVHWFMTPQGYRREINGLWRTINNPRLQAMTRLSTVAEYRIVTAAAINAVNAKVAENARAKADLVARARADAWPGSAT